MNKTYSDFAKLSPETVVEAIKADTGNSFININEELKSTEKLISIKDIHSWQGHNVTMGSKMLENYIASYDSEVVRLLKADGYNIAGTNNLDEFAMGSTNKTSYFGAVDNAYNPQKVSGGSSGGSAYAVAKGLVPVATGTDTGGSVRQPAAFNGIYGMKPTYGLISRYGTLAFVSSFDTVGVLSNTIEDNMQTLKTLAKNDPKDQTNFVPEDFQVDNLINKDLKGMKAVIVKEWMEDDYSPEIKAAIAKQVEILKTKGVEIKEVSLPLLTYSLELYVLLAYSEVSSNLNRYDGIRFGALAQEDKENYYADARNAFGTEVKKRLIIGTYMISSDNSKKYFDKAQMIRQEITNQIDKLFKEENVDFIIGPTTPNLAFKKDAVLDAKESYLSDKFAIPANLAGIPAMNIPIGFSKNNLPIGMQIMADKYAENKIYQVAKHLEGAEND